MNKKILAVIDVQNDFIDGSLRNEEAIKKVPNIVKKIKDFDGDAIIYTLDTHDTDYLKSREGKLLPVEHCIRDTEGWNLNKDVEEAINDAQERGVAIYAVAKPTFGDLAFAEAIDDFTHGEDFELEFVGFCTDICVVSNVLIAKAVFYDTADIAVDSSCCAGVTPEKHEAALETMRSCQINVK